MGKNIHTQAPSLYLDTQNTFLNLHVRPIQSYPMPIKEHML